MVDLPDLLSRLEAMEAPDVSVDVDLCVYFQFTPDAIGDKPVRVRNVRRPDEPDWDDDELFYDTEEWGECVGSAPKFTASIDAGLMLLEHTLPGWTYLLNSDNGFSADIFPPTWPHGRNYEGVRPSMALSLCLAILRAHEAANAKGGAA